MERIEPHRLRALILDDLARYPASSSPDIPDLSNRAAPLPMQSSPSNSRRHNARRQPSGRLHGPRDARCSRVGGRSQAALKPVKTGKQHACQTVPPSCPPQSQRIAPSPALSRRPDIQPRTMPLCLEEALDFAAFVKSLRRSGKL